jgi:hypothetical protein
MSLGGDCDKATHESSSVGSKVLEEVGKTVKRNETSSAAACGSQLVVTETERAEDTGQKNETHKLNGLSANLVDQEEGTPVSRDQTSNSENDVSDSDVVQVGVDLLCGCTGGGATETNLGENDGRIETETVESDIESEPRPSTPEQDLAVLPLTVVSSEILEGSLGCFNSLNRRIRVDDKGTSGQVRVNILRSLLDVALDIHSVSRGFRDRQSEVQGDGTGHTSHTDQDSPTIVDVQIVTRIVLDLVLETRDDADGDDGGCQVTPALGSKHGGHHSTSDSLRGEFRSDDGGKRVITTDS